MTNNNLLSILERVKNGTLSPENAANAMQSAPFDNLGYAMVDHHRALRQGVNEVIYGMGKTAEQICGILDNMTAHGAKDIIITRLCPESAAKVSAQFPLSYHPLPEFGIVCPTTDMPLRGNIIVASGGTSDIPVCEEAALTAETLGNHVTRLYDVGVAGIHRLLSHTDTLQKARVIIAVAGMEGALPSVLGGLVSCPVIAVPTSVGYGANLGGVTALLAMLNSCASGISVVNIDNGFGAGFLASRINQMEGIK